MFNIQSSHPNAHFDQLQRDFLESSPSKIYIYWAENQTSKFLQLFSNILNNDYKKM